eukprot:jgi/Mesen1/9530/ME000639S08913
MGRGDYIHSQEGSFPTIPWELQHKILAMACRSNGLLACQLATVCRAWRLLPRDSAMWHHADVSLAADCRISNDIIQQLVSWGAWGKLVSLKLEGARIADRSLELIARRCPQLEALSISRCPLSKPTGLIEIFLECKKLRQLRATGVGARVMAALEAQPGQLRELSWTNAALSGSHLGVLGAGCVPHLRVLDLSGGALCAHRGCPRLEVLRIAALPHGFSRAPNPPAAAAAAAAPGGADSPSPAAPGFPELVELTASRQASFDDCHLARTLGASRKLRVLDVSASRVTGSGLEALPCEHLAVLRVSWSPAASDDGVARAAARWGHSLRELDCSRRPLESSDPQRAAAPPTAGLRTLGAAGAAAIARSCEALTALCGRSLTLLDTSGCRDMPRHLRAMPGRSLAEFCALYPDLAAGAAGAAGTVDATGVAPGAPSGRQALRPGAVAAGLSLTPAPAGAQTGRRRKAERDAGEERALESEEEAVPLRELAGARLEGRKERRRAKRPLGEPGKGQGATSSASLRQETSKRRRKGLFGAELYDEDEDSDYVPSGM